MAAFVKQGAHGAHITAGAAGEDLSLSIVRYPFGQKLKTEPARGRRPIAFIPNAFAEEERSKTRGERDEPFQFRSKNDVGRRSGAVNEYDVAIESEVNARARHRHERRHARTRGQVKRFLGSGRGRRREGARRAVRAQLTAGLHGVVKPVRHGTARHALDGDRKQIRPRRRRRNRVAALDQLPLHVRRHRHELTRFEANGRAVAHAKLKAFDIVSFIHHPSAGEDTLFATLPRLTAALPGAGARESIFG